MRLSVDPTDPGYCGWRGYGSLVFLDGTQLSGVITADEEQRMVLVHCLDERGRVILNEDRTEVKTETRYGHVRIELSASMNLYLNGQSDKENPR